MNANEVAGGSAPAGVSRAPAIRSAIALLNAIGVGVVLPRIFFVNDLGHPLQNGLLLSLMPAGRLVGKCMPPRRGADNSNPRQLLPQGVALTLSYLLFAASAELHPTGIYALRLAQLAWFLVGLFGANLLFQRRYSDDNSRAAPAGVSVVGLAVGALACSALTWRLVRSPERYDMTGLLGPALVAAACSAIAVLLFSIKRYGFPAEHTGTIPTTQALATGNPDQRNAIYVSAGATCAAAIACTLAPLMLWESFAFSPGEIALTIAAGGLIAISVNFLIGRMLLQYRSIALVGIGLFLLGVSVIPMMLAPGAASLSFAIAGCVILSVALGFLQSTLSSLIGLSYQGLLRESAIAANDVARTLSWIIGPILCTSIFYAHERTSFGLSGVVIGFTAMPFATLWRRGLQKLNNHESDVVLRSV